MGCLNNTFKSLLESEYGQARCEGVHGLRGVKQHRTTFLLARVPPLVDERGEVIEDEEVGTSVCNTDLNYTMRGRYDASAGEGRGVKSRGIGGDRPSFDENGFCRGAEEKKEL